MNERDIFIATLEMATAAERSDYLRVACGGDTQLRERLEELLQMHEQTGEFLQKPLVERLAEHVATLGNDAETARDSSSTRSGSEDLGFLSPSDESGSLGRLGHYEVQEVIGSGGMGIVLRAFDTRLHRVVAIKVMAAPLATNAAARKRFLREARAAAAVCHDHIVTIHAVEESGDLPYLVMQCVSGLSLQERLDRDGPLALHEILRIGMQTAAGLAAAHAQGLIHRDIKPANILLENGVERVKITDFGLARAAADASVSQTGIVAGTPQYMAPEQARGEALDCRTDLFSLGSVLYAMCTGRAPFRAANSMAVLKQVCDDAPSLIREASTDVPEWLIAVINKLQAKNPDDRYQSAAEVANLLGQRLAQLQHSTPLPPLATLKSAPTRPAAQRSRTWAIAAAILLGLTAMFGMAEGTGATKFAATAIRLLTPEGTLVVEVDDPDVKLTIEGDGGLVISGAGLHEVRLKPGSYKLQADKNGKPVSLEREQVSIAKDGREVVKVKLEGPPARVVAKTETGAFVVFGGNDIAERKFDTLAEAVQGASDGDTIEIRGNGPFITKRLNLRNRALVIRAGAGFRPLVKADPDESALELIQSNARLVLEGLDLQWIDATPAKSDSRSPCLIVCLGPQAQFHAANCRIVMNRRDGVNGEFNCISVWNAPLCSLRNCQFVVAGRGEGNGSALALNNDSNIRVLVENCLLHSPWLGMALNEANPIKARLRRSTILGGTLNKEQVWGLLRNKNALALAEAPAPSIEFELSGNLLALPFLWFHQWQSLLDEEKSLSAAEAEQFLKKSLAWRGTQNIFSMGDQPLLNMGVGDKHLPLPSTFPIWTLDEWNRFWEAGELDGQLGQARFQGGDPVDKAAANPELLTPDDFRLREDSPGYRAGPDGKDLGADVDLVGPGAAYERWKKTPEYQEWLNETMQMK